MDDPAALLLTVVANSLHDIRGLKNFVYQQSVNTKVTTHVNLYTSTTRTSEEVLETVIANGEVFSRRVKQNGKMVDATKPNAGNEKTASFDTVAVFGPNVPFENLPDLFEVKQVEDRGDRIVLKLDRNDKPGKALKYRVKVEVLRESMRVAEVQYDLAKPTARLVEQRIACKFSQVNGYWLPQQTVLRTETPHRTIEQDNQITYKAFHVNTRVVTDLK